MIKVGKDGIELSHERYLSDSSTGMIFYLNFLWLIDQGFIQINFLSNQVDSSFITRDLVIILLLFFLVTTFGMIISVLSWCFLEYFHVKFFEKIWWKNRAPLKFIQFSPNFKDILRSNGIEYSNWHSSVTSAETILEMNSVSVSRLLIQRSIRIFLRNTAFIGLIDLFFSMLHRIWGVSFLILLFIFVTLLISSFLSFYCNAGFIVKYELFKNQVVK